MKKILIVDDSLLDRKLLMNVLKKACIDNEILQASDGQEGLDTLNANVDNIGLVLLDWQMPNLDGIGFMEATQKVPELVRLPIVMITASGSDESKQLAYNTNPYLAGYIVKPYKPDYLIETISPHVK